MKFVFVFKLAQRAKKLAARDRVLGATEWCAKKSSKPETLLHGRRGDSYVMCTSDR